MSMLTVQGMRVQMGYGLPVRSGVYTPAFYFSQPSTGSGEMMEIKTQEEWESLMDSELPIVLQAGAGWCGPCQMLKPMMIQKAKEFGDSV